jgi:hypothetical protein
MNKNTSTFKLSSLSIDTLRKIKGGGTEILIVAIDGSNLPTDPFISETDDDRRRKKNILP